MVKIFKAFQRNPSYDEDQEMIILADNLMQAKEMAYENWKFRGNKKELLFEEIPLDENKIICISHYGD